MQKLSNKFLKKDWTFDFIYLFNSYYSKYCFLISTYLLFNKPLFEADDLKLLRTPEKLLMVVIVIPIIEEFSMRGLFVVNNKLNIILWTLCLIAVFYLYFTTVGFNTSNVRANHFKSTIIFNFEFRRTFNRFISNYFLFFYV
jgi:hypothetical protein